VYFAPDVHKPLAPGRRLLSPEFESFEGDETFLTRFHQDRAAAEFCRRRTDMRRQPHLRCHHEHSICPNGRRPNKAQMKRVTGIGGIFFQARDPVGLRVWYKKHLAIDVQEWGGAAFTWTDDAGNPTRGTTIWSVGAQAAITSHQARRPSWSTTRVDNLAALLQALRNEGCNVLEKNG